MNLSQIAKEIVELENKRKKPELVKNSELIKNDRACGDNPCPAVQGPYEGCFAVPAWLKDSYRYNDVLFVSALENREANPFAPVVMDDFSLMSPERKGESTVRFPRILPMDFHTFTASCSDDATTGGNDYTCNRISNNLSSMIDFVQMTLNKTTERTINIDVDRYDEENAKLSLGKSIAFALKGYMTRIRNGNITTAFQNPVVTRRVYGGNATSVSQLAVGDCISHNSIKRVATYFTSMGYSLDDVYGFISPMMREHLSNEPTTWQGGGVGFSDELKTGLVPVRAGIKLITTPYVPEYHVGDPDVNEGVAWPVAGEVAIFAAKSPTVTWDVAAGPMTAPVCLGWKKNFELKIIEEKCRKNVYEATYNMGAAMVNECPVVLGKFSCECA